jgi:hypothetical protein
MARLRLLWVNNEKRLEILKPGFPPQMVVFGEGGIAGVASVCGELNGAAAAIYLITGSLEKDKRELAFSITRDLFTRPLQLV